MDLSIIIVNYNVRQFLENALASISRALEGIEGEIFVVDNGSDDGSVVMVRSLYPSVHVIENAENLGFARANNQALTKASGRYLLLINPDTIVQEDTFRVMLAFFDSNKEAGLAGCKILNPDGSFQLPCRRSFPTPWVAFTKVYGLAALFPSSELFGRYNLTYLDPDQTYPVDAVSGSFMMVRRAVYEQVGGLDETFFMYGEDLDWCFRVAQAGHKVYYVHNTSIIHFKGESTRRSNIDEVRVFYHAMQVFVAKHFGDSRVLRVFLSLGISLRETIEGFRRRLQPLVLAAVDAVLIDVALFMSAFVYFGNPLTFLEGANRIVWFAPALLIVSLLAGVGAYRGSMNSPVRVAFGTLGGFVLVSAAVFFVKNLAYSRAVVLLSALVCLILLPALRVVMRVWSVGTKGHAKRKSLFGSRTLIVGAGPAGCELLRRLRTRVDDGYDIVGFIDTTSGRIGERVDGIPVLGSIENVGKVIGEQRVSDVIFSTDALTYGEILSVITRSDGSGVNFRLVPNSLEAIIGKTSIDRLEMLPMVEIEYNIRRPGHKFVKRLLDMLGGIFGFVVLYLPVSLFARGGKTWQVIRYLPSVVAGKLSLVGLPVDDGRGLASELSQRCHGADLGPQGIMGLIQLNRRADLGMDECERYALYYAKNQSLTLDIEIILKAFLRLRQADRAIVDNVVHHDS